jgi:solute carrier family 25 (mitochondrial 2-oxodicarboxylate transporter), member 21
MSAPDVKRTPPNTNLISLALPFQYQFAAGAIAGVTEILVMYPLDVVKTRFQLQVKGTGEQYTGMLDCFQKIIKNEGSTLLLSNLIIDLEGYIEELFLLF